MRIYEEDDDDEDVGRGDDDGDDDGDDEVANCAFIFCSISSSVGAGAPFARRW